MQPCSDGLPRRNLTELRQDSGTHGPVRPHTGRVEVIYGTAGHCTGRVMGIYRAVRDQSQARAGTFQFLG